MTVKSTTIALLAAAAGTHAAALGSRQSAPTWGDCPEELSANATAPVQCANLAVPLDYSQPDSTDTLDLNLLKVSATREPKKGTILVNFGGPGLGVRGSLSADGKNMLAYTGGHYDIIGWDPRGTEDTLTFSCFGTQEERTIVMSQSPYVGNSSDLLVSSLNWASAKGFANACALFPDAQAKGELIGTAFTARDAMQIVDAVEEDGLLRYWGFSYGTALGSTIAAMFPDRIDKVLLDGVMNVHQYYNGYDSEMNADTDATMDEFFRSCFDTPENCALAHDDNTPESVQAAWWEYFERVKYDPDVIASIIIDQTRIAGTIRPLLYGPGSWPTLSLLIDGLLTGNVSRIEEGYTAVQALLPSYATTGFPDDSAFGIQGSDKGPRPATLNDYKPGMDEFEAESKLIGPMMATGQMRYLQWPYVAKERYTGDFKVATRKPLMFIGNSFDPATPLRSAQNMSSGFEGSVVLEHGGVGHCSTNHPSVCTVKAIQAYFNDGTLPEPDTKCETTVAPFNVTAAAWTDLLAQVGF